MAKSDVQEQRLYLNRLPKYQIKAKAVNSSRPMYLMKPGASKDDLILKFTESFPGDIFCFDEENGWLLPAEVDRYNYMHRAHVKSVFPTSTNTMKVCWKRSAMVTELAPYQFMGRFQAREERVMGQVREIGLEWEFSGDRGSEKRRWDTKHTRHARNFEINVQNHELTVVNPWNMENDSRRGDGMTGELAVPNELTVPSESGSSQPGEATAVQGNILCTLLLVPVLPGTEME
jgi:hypothetical protein